MHIRREKSRLGQPLSACSGTGVFVGYASLFGVRDASRRHGDARRLRGIAEKTPGGKYPHAVPA